MTTCARARWRLPGAPRSDNPWKRAATDWQAALRAGERRTEWISISPKSRTCSATWCAACCAEHCPIDVVRQHRGRPARLPRRRSGSSSPSSASTGILMPEAVRRRRPVAARCGDRLRGARPRAGAVAALRRARCSARARSCSRGQRRRRRSDVAAAHRERRGDPDAGLARARRQLPPAGVQLRATPDGDGFRLSGVKRHVAFARAADRLIVLARTARGGRDRPLPGRSERARASRCEQQLTLASDAQYELALRGRARAGRGAHRRRGLAAGSTWSARDARRDRAARGAGDGRRRARARDHGRVREEAQAVRQAARRVPGDLATTWPTPRRGSTAAARSSTRRPGRAPQGKPTRPGSRRWRSSSRARPTATSPRCASRSGAASASRSSTTSSSTSGARSSSSSRGGTRATLEELVAAAVLDGPAA